MVIPTYFELIKTCLFEMGDCVKPFLIEGVLYTCVVEKEQCTAGLNLMNMCVILRFKQLGNDKSVKHVLLLFVNFTLFAQFQLHQSALALLRFSNSFSIAISYQHNM